MGTSRHAKVLLINPFSLFWNYLPILQVMHGVWPRPTVIYTWKFVEIFRHKHGECKVPTHPPNSGHLFSRKPKMACK